MDLIALFIASVLSFLIMLLPLAMSLIAIVLYIIGFILEGVAFTKLAKEKPVKYLWMVWVPMLSEYFGKKAAMSDISNKSEIHMLCGKWVFKNRLTPCWIYLGTMLAFYVLSFVFSILAYIPIIGIIFLLIFILLSILVAVWWNMVEYVYLRDLLNSLKENVSSNVGTATWITIANIFTFGLVRAIYLFKLSNSLSKVASDETCEKESSECEQE